MRLALLAAVAVLVYVAVCGALALCQRRLIYYPDTSLPDPRLAATVGATPTEVATTDGLSLHCWYLAPKTPAAPVVLYLHGNAGNVGNRAGRLVQFGRLGWGVLLLEYRGYGGNAGAPSEAGLMTDARAGLEALLRMGIARSGIVVWGESLGTGVAVGLVAQNAVGALVLEAPFMSLTDLAQRKLPWLPVRLLLRDRFDSLSRITAIRVPLFVIAGEQDGIVPLAVSRTLFAAANAPKDMLVEPAAGHNGLGTPAAFDAVARFVANHLAR